LAFDAPPYSHDSYVALLDCAWEKVALRVGETAGQTVVDRNLRFVYVFHCHVLVVSASKISI
jgi:hypothetical protein